MSAAVPRPPEETGQRVLDAAFASVERFGLTRTTMSGVAQAARMSRQTVYRYFPTKHALLAALVLREEERLIALVRGVVRGHDEAQEAIRAGILATFNWLREHPLLDPLLKTEPEQLLPYLTVEAHPLLTLGMRATEEIFRERLPEVPPESARRAAETLNRIMLSYAITPPTESPEDVARWLATLFTDALARP